MADGAGRREERRQQTAQRIYEKAVRLFEERGFESVTVGEIAEGAGISVPTFYAHYASKEALLMSIPTREQLEAVLATQPEDLPAGARLRGAIRPWLAMLAEAQREAVLERWRIIARTPALRIRTAEFERTTAALVIDALPRDAGQGRPSGTEVAVNAVMAAYTQILLRWADEDGRRDLLDVADEVFAELRDLI